MARLTLNFLFLCGRVGVTGAAAPLWRRAFSAACPVSPLAQEDVAHGQSSSLSRVLVLEQASCLMPDGSIKYLFRRMLIALKCSTRSTKPSVGGSQARGEAATCGHMQGGAAGRGGRRGQGRRRTEPVAPPSPGTLAVVRVLTTFWWPLSTVGQGAGDIHAAAAVRLAGPRVVRPPAHLPAGAVRRVLPGAAAARGAAGW